MWSKRRTASERTEIQNPNAIDNYCLYPGKCKWFGYHFKWTRKKMHLKNHKLWPFIHRFKYYARNKRAACWILWENVAKEKHIIPAWSKNQIKNVIISKSSCGLGTRDAYLNEAPQSHQFWMQVTKGNDKSNLQTEPLKWFWMGLRIIHITI